MCSLLYCTWKKHISRFHWDKSFTAPVPSESDFWCAERGREAKRRLVILLAKWGPPAGRLPLPLPLTPPLPLSPGSADRPPHPGTEKPSGVCLGQFTGGMHRVYVCVCVSSHARMNVWMCHRVSSAAHVWTCRLSVKSNKPQVNDKMCENRTHSCFTFGDDLLCNKDVFTPTGWFHTLGWWWRVIQVCV